MSREEFDEGWTGRLLSLSPTSRLEENAPAKTTLGRYLPFFAPYRFLLFEVLIASVILEVLQLASPVFTQVIVDKVLVHQNVNMLNVMLGGMLIIGFFQIATGLLRQYLLIHVSQKLSLRFASDLFRQLLRLPIRFFHTRKIGDLLQRFSDNEKIQDILTGTAITTLLDILTIFLVMGLMFFYNTKLALVGLVGVPFYVAVTLWFTPLLKRNSQRAFEKAAIQETDLVECIDSVATIKNCTAEHSVRWKHENLLVQGANVGFNRAKLEMALGGISSSIRILSMTFMLWYGAHLVISGELSVGQLMAFQVLVGMVIAPIMGLIGLWDELQEAHLALQRLTNSVQIQSTRRRPYRSMAPKNHT
jgi:ATP-binding cassette subfamily B protein